MKDHAVTRALACTITMLAVLAAAAGPAHAGLTPAGGRTSWFDFNVTYRSSTGNTVRCPTVDFTRVIAAGGGSLSVEGFFSGNAFGGTCTTSFGFSVQSFTIFWTERSTASLAGVSASGDVQLDARSTSIIPVGLGCSVTISGPQTFRSAWTFQQSTQTMTVSLRGIRASGSGGLCGGAQTIDFTTTSTLAGSRITIS